MRVCKIRERIAGKCARRAQRKIRNLQQSCSKSDAGHSVITLTLCILKGCWSRGRELNSRPADFESAALPLSYLGSVLVFNNLRAERLRLAKMRSLPLSPFVILSQCNASASSRRWVRWVAENVLNHFGRNAERIVVSCQPPAKNCKEYDLFKIGRRHLGNPGVVVGSETRFLLQDMNLALHLRHLIV